MKSIHRNILVFTVALVGILIVYLVGRSPKSPALPQPGPAENVESEETTEVDIQLSPQELVFSSQFWESATLDSLRELRSAGVDLKTYDDQGWTPLMHAAVSCSDTGVLSEIIAYSGDLFYTSEDGNSLLNLIDQNEILKNTGLHKEILNWHQNELHYQMTLQMEKERQEMEERKGSGADEESDPTNLPDDSAEPADSSQDIENEVQNTGQPGSVL